MPSSDNSKIMKQRKQTSHTKTQPERIQRGRKSSLYHPLPKETLAKPHKGSVPPNTQGEIRIIGGDFRGRKLPVLVSEGLRPTSDRVRETVFNWLQFDLAGARCLDVFAGSGALGFEALSRGAKRVEFIEFSGPVAKQLQANARLLKLDSEKVSVTQADACLWLDKPAASPFDVVFLDPPFHQGLLEEVVQLLFNNHWVHEGSWIYLEQERSKALPQLPGGWQLIREKTTSQVVYGLYQCR